MKNGENKRYNGNYFSSFAYSKLHAKLYEYLVFFTFKRALPSVSASVVSVHYTCTGKGEETLDKFGLTFHLLHIIMCKSWQEGSP